VTGHIIAEFGYLKI